MKQTYVAVKQKAEVRYAAPAVRGGGGGERNQERRLAQQGEQTSCDVVETGREIGSSAIVFHGLRLRETSSDVASENRFWKFD